MLEDEVGLEVVVGDGEGTKILHLDELMKRTYVYSPPLGNSVSDVVTLITQLYFR